MFDSISVHLFQEHRWRGEGLSY